MSWSRAFGTPGEDVVHGVAVLPDQTIALTGEYAGTLDYGSVRLPAHGGADILLAGLTASGEPSWAAGYGGAGRDAWWDLSATPSGGLLLTGEAGSGVGRPS